MRPNQKHAADSVRKLRGQPDGYIVIFNGRQTSPTFNSHGAAEAYLDALEAGTRNPEYWVNPIGV